MIPAVDRPAPELASTELSGTPVREVVRSGSDPEAALEFYREVYDGRDMAFEPSPERFGFRYRATGDDRVSLRTSSVSAARSGILAPERQYLLAWSVEGGIVVDDDRADAVTLRPGVPVLYPAGRPFHVWAPPGTKHLVHVDADFLEAVAVVGTDSAPVPLAFPVTAQPDRLVGLQTVLRRVARPLLDVSVVGPDRAALDLRLAEAVLAAFRTGAGPPERVAPAGNVERAKAFMHAHFDRVLAATDIAAAADVSVRTLQEGFQRREGSTPMAYLRDLRLEKARLGLQLADPRETSVAMVAHSCGFRHMGRFSGSYRDAYGEYPGDTLRGRRRLVGAADIVG
ncbi:helix-turn-helix domain-containing protein [Curtobacterium sp. AB451]|uniref:helix-turn-helix domain-containing protein n=1 Tax=Curtobacterium sp. AB451 TaxID=3422306 RepID=UPI003D337772